MARRIRWTAPLLIVAAVVAALALAVAGHGATASVADGQCTNGHNWDNIHQTCG